MSAWSLYYKRGTGFQGSTLPPDYPDLQATVAYAVKAIKTELKYRGETGMNENTYYFGDGAASATRDFQKKNGLEVDGVVGPQTGKALFKARAFDVELYYHIPNHYLAKIAQLESAWDPGAIGTVDPNDRGLLQINLHFHPDVSLAQAVDASFALPWGGRNLAAAYGSLGDWDAAVASWNVGYVAARNWLNAGKQSDGSTAWKYVQLVKGQVV